MPLETNFNAAPYFDDYSANSNYYRVLFKPSTAVQARELTQLQSILQDQIDKFGRHIFKDGSVVEGVTPINYDNNLSYVKLQDLDTSGTVVNVAGYLGRKLVNSANLQALVVNFIPGVEANDPDLNTLYIRYINSALYANGIQQKTFDPTETLVVKTRDNITVATIKVASDFYTPIGKGYAVSTSKGVIFKNGVFIEVTPQTIIVSKYTTLTNDITVGFTSSESVITADSDESLYDNAIGSPNLNAPGASRLRINCNLSYRYTENTSTTYATANTSNFFSLVKFQDGAPNLLFTDAQYSKLGADMARRTYEESGNYIVDPFEITVSSNTYNENSLVLEVDKGAGYVQGYRVEFADKNKVEIAKGINTEYFPNQIITGNYGNFVYVKEVCGPFDTFNFDEVELYTQASAHLTARDYTTSGSVPGGVKIGIARVRNIEYFSGIPGTPSAQYKLFLFDIKISSGSYSFSDVKSIYAIDASNVVSYADIVLDANNEAVLKESASRDMVFSVGRNAIKTINAVATSYTFRANSVISFAANGTATFTPPSVHAGGTNVLSLTGNLSEANESRFIIIPTATVNAQNLASVSVSGNTTTNVIVGNTSTFSTNFVVGDYIKIFDTATNNIRRVTALTNATAIGIDANLSFTNTAAVISRTFPVGVPISLFREDSANIMITNTTSGAINLGTNLSSTMSAYFYYDSIRNSASAASKVVNKTRFVKIAANTHPNKNVGPWNIGISDVIKIKKIYQGTTYSNTNTDYASNFIIDNGQRGSHYGHATISINPATGHSIGNNDLLLVELDHFTPSYSSGIGYFSFNSYPIDDANTANTSAVQTAEVQVFKSDTGAIYDLRDSIDFRPYVLNTANSASTAANATINPNNQIVYTVDSDGPYTISPDSNFNTAFTYYLGRKIKIALSPNGKLNVVDGTPSTNPVTPKDLDGTMTLGIVAIPPYPSLSQIESRNYSRYDYGVSIQLDQYRRYTMKDIGVLDKKLTRLEYYTTLSLLEASAKTLIVKDDAGAERFKNGFIVDSFKGFTTSDTSSPEYKAAIDYKVQELAPTIKRSYVKLDYNSSNSVNVIKNNNLIYINANSVPYITQSFASKTRNCTENLIYTYNGKIILDPPGDVEPDVNVNPDVVSNIDLSGISDFINGVPNVIGAERVISTSSIDNSVSSQSTNVTNIPGGTNIRTTTDTIITTATTTNTVRNDIDFSASTITNKFDFGEVVQDISFQFYMKPRRIKFSASGLKPSTIVYPYFDGVPVFEHCTPADSDFDRTDEVLNYTRSKNAGEDVTPPSLITDSLGRVYGFFDMPATTFKTGDRIFKLVDVDDLTIGASSFTTQATIAYMGSNISITKARLGLSTRLPEVSSTNKDVLDSRTSFSTRQTSTKFDTVISNPPAPPAVEPDPPIVEPTPRPRPDPVTFTANTEAPKPSTGVTITVIDPGPGSTANSDGGTTVLYVDTPVKDGNTDTITTGTGTSTTSGIYDTIIVKDVSVPPIEPTPEPAPVDVELRFEQGAQGGGSNAGEGSNGEGAGGEDPIAQSFLVGDDGSSIGVFIDKLDLYFRTKHASLGVEVQIRHMENGAPTTKILPFGRKSLPSSQVNLSADASVATTFYFDSPIYLQRGQEYCFVVVPESSNDGYLIWLSELSGTDITTNTPIYVNNATGVLFTSSTNTIWSPYQKEDIKFVLYRLDFNSTGGTIVYNNANIEYLTVNNFKGNFIANEKIFASNGTVVMTSNVSTSNTSNAVSVVANGSSNAQAMFVNNSYIYISSNTGLQTNIRNITSIPNSSHIVLNASLSFNDSNSSIGYLSGNAGLSGFASRVSPDENIMYLSESSANSTVGFTNVISTNAGLLIGGESGARANLVSVDSINYSVIIPQFSYISPIGTAVSLRIKTSDGTSMDTAFTGITSDIETFFTDKERKIKSRSQELESGGAKSLIVSIPVFTNDRKVSPAFDSIKENIIAIENVINNYANTANEINTFGGSSKAKYVSKRVILAEGQDAEDILVYLSAYKPAQTDINVYIKLLNGEDSDSIKQKAWTPLNQNTSSAVISSRVDRNDFKEFSYDAPAKYSINAASSTAMADYSIYGTFANTAVGANSVLSISNTTPLAPDSLIYFIGTGVATGISNGFYNIFFANTSTVQLSNTNSANVTTITSLSSANTGTIYEVPLTGFKDRYEANTISYYTSAGAHFYTYKTFAIKIIMTSEEGSHIVPRISDMRAIALQL